MARLPGLPRSARRTRPGRRRRLLHFRTRPARTGSPGDRTSDPAGMGRAPPQHRPRPVHGARRGPGRAGQRIPAAGPRAHRSRHGQHHPRLQRTAPPHRHRRVRNHPPRGREEKEAHAGADPDRTHPSRHPGDQTLLHDVPARGQPVPASRSALRCRHLRRGQPGQPRRRHQLHLPRLSPDPGRRPETAPAGQLLRRQGRGRRRGMVGGFRRHRGVRVDPRPGQGIRRLPEPDAALALPVLARGADRVLQRLVLRRQTHHLPQQAQRRARRRRGTVLGRRNLPAGNLPG